MNVFRNQIERIQAPKKYVVTEERREPKRKTKPEIAWERMKVVREYILSLGRDVTAMECLEWLNATHPELKCAASTFKSNITYVVGSGVGYGPATDNKRRTIVAE